MYGFATGIDVTLVIDGHACIKTDATSRQRLDEVRALASIHERRIADRLFKPSHAHVGTAKRAVAVIDDCYPTAFRQFTFQIHVPNTQWSTIRLAVRGGRIWSDDW